MREVDVLHKFISVHSVIYLNSNTPNTQKQKLAKNEIQGDFRNKSISDCTAARPFVHIFFISERKKISNNKNFGDHCPHTTSRLE